MWYILFEIFETKKNTLNQKIVTKNKEKILNCIETIQW